MALLQSPERLINEWKLDRWAEEGRKDEDEDRIQGGREGAIEEKVLRVLGVKGGKERRNENAVLAEAHQVLVDKPGRTKDEGGKEDEGRKEEGGLLKTGKEGREGKEGEKEDEMLFKSHQIVSRATMLWTLPGLEKFAALLGEMQSTREGGRARVREWGLFFQNVDHISRS